MKKPTILAITDYYAPAVRAGGGHLAVRNMAEWLSDDFDFRVLTADCDLGETTPYPNITYGAWHTIGKAQVRYLSRRERSTHILAKIITETPHDLIYLNSFFGRMSVKTTTARRMNRLKKTPILISPHGEFYERAITYKHLKKQVYLVLSKLIGMYASMLWHATNADEAQQIQKHIGIANNKLCIAPVLPAPISTLPAPTQKQIGELKIIYLSRITPKKNLDGALRLLMDVQHPVQFDIYGTEEDPAYWQTCQTIMGQLPAHIQARYCGAITEGQIERFSQYHLFLFPTLGENFGYVIQESLLGGCLPLISTNTPWRGFADKQIGWDIPLDQPDQFVKTIEHAYEMDGETFAQWSQNAQAYGIATTQDLSRIDANRALFHFALKGNP